RLFDRRTGLVAALLVAVAPLPLFYSREARMYALVACLALASLWLFLRGLAASRSGPATETHSHGDGNLLRASQSSLRSSSGTSSQIGLWIAYTLVGALTAYVHYLGALLIAGQAAAAVALRRRAPHVLRPMMLAGVVIVGLALPWLLVAGGTRASLPALSLEHLAGLPAALWSAWRDLAAGPEASGLVASLAALALFALTVAGFPRRQTARVAAGATLLAGLAGLVFVIALGKPVQARYVLPVAPLAFICAAAAMRRRFGLLLGGVLVLAGFLPFWPRYYTGYARADYSDLTRRIAALERPGDAVLLTGPWQAWYFDYYYTGSIVHDVLPHDAPPALDPDEAMAQLEALADTHRRLWFVQAGLAQADPTNFVERWLLRHAWPASRQAHQNAVLSHYALQPPGVTRPLRPTTFGDVVRLSGGWVDGEEVPAGDVVRLALEFEVLQPVSVNYKASLRLAGADGQRAVVDFDLVDRTGEAPRGTSDWTAGQRITVRRGIWAPASLGPQPYSVRLVVYDPATLAPLAPDSAVALQTERQAVRFTPGGEAPVGDVYVTQSLAGLPAWGEAPYRPIDRRFGGGDAFDALHLVGVRWGQANPSAGPLTFDLLWRLEGFSGTEHRSTVTIADASGAVWAEETRPLFGGTFAMRDWRDGETLAERRVADLTALPPGHYRLVVGLEDARGRDLPLDGRPGAVELARFELPYRRPIQERLAHLVGRLAPARLFMTARASGVG
ncbi:MAG: hypothetical protein ACRDJN_19500, partial [Chloroflexota bacterium]